MSWIPIVVIVTYCTMYIDCMQFRTTTTPYLIYTFKELDNISSIYLYSWNENIITCVCPTTLLQQIIFIKIIEIMCLSIICTWFSLSEHVQRYVVKSRKKITCSVNRFHSIIFQHYFLVIIKQFAIFFFLSISSS